LTCICSQDLEEIIFACDWEHISGEQKSGAGKLDVRELQGMSARKRNMARRQAKQAAKDAQARKTYTVSFETVACFLVFADAGGRHITCFLFVRVDIRFKMMMMMTQTLIVPNVSKQLSLGILIPVARSFLPYLVSCLV